VKKRIALDLPQALPPEHTLLLAQALGELFHVLVRKARKSRGDGGARSSDGAMRFRSSIRRRRLSSQR
jgi:predicted nucleic acid-binding protein